MPAPLYLFPCSSAQRRLWVLERLHPGSSVYNLPAAVPLAGPMDHGVLEGALRALVARHEILRTAFAEQDGEPVQLIDEAATLALPLIDLAALAPDERAARVRLLAAEDASRPFALGRAPLLRATLLRLAPTEHVLLVTLHHLVADGWSIGIFWRELQQVYETALAGRPADLPALPLQYADYAVWEREQLDAARLAPLLDYWRERLAGLEALALPLDHPRPALRSHAGGRCTRLLPVALAQGLKTLAAEHEATLFMSLLAGFAALLARYSGQTDIVLGTPVAGRSEVAFENVMGCFVNTLLLRLDCAGNPPFSELLARARETALGAFAQQALPFGRLVEALQPERDLRRNPLFQVALVLHQTTAGTVHPGGGDIDLAADRGAAVVDLALHLWLREDGLVAQAEFAAELFEATTIEILLGALQEVLGAAVADPQCRLGELPLMAAADEARLLAEWSGAPTLPDAAEPLPEAGEAPLSVLFEQQADRTPDGAAVAWDEQSLDYRTLDERASRLARRLARHLSGSGTPVGVCLARGPDLLLAFLAVLKAGGVYLPLDPALPAGRLHFMLGDAGAAFALADAAGVPRLKGAACAVLAMDEEKSAASRETGGRLAPPAGGDALAYIIYTSGSTGRPKGVQIPHRGVVQVLAAQRRLLALAPQARVLQGATIGFDASIFEFLMAFGSGATLHFPPPAAQLPGSALIHFLASRRIGAALITPSVLAVLPPAPLPALQLLMVAGEACSAELARRWGQGRRLLNLYGPTETSIWATCAECTATVEGREAGAPPIGRAIGQVRLYVLDAWSRPLPPGVAGELYIGGPGLARGYLGSTPVNAERFVADVFGAQPGGRLYRSGDRVRWRADGQLEYLGRIDEQIKLRGQRIEPGEIESVLLQAPGVREVAVVCHEEADSGPCLIAYVVADEGLAAEWSEEALRAALAVSLPAAMLPARILPLAALPRTPAGKLDRRTLAARRPAPAAPAAAQEGPESRTEAALARLWQEVLGLAAVGREAHFFDLGGHSLLVTKLASRVREAFGIELPLRRFFEAPTLAAQAGLIDAQGSGEALDTGEL